MRSIDNCGILSHNRTQLKQCSYDKAHSEYMTNLEIQAVNFDKVKTEYLKELGYSEEKCKSVDAVLETGDETIATKVVLVEFKNGDIQKNEIGQKARDSLLLLCDIMDTGIKETRELFTFVLVYNQDAVHFDSQTCKIIAMANRAGRPCPKYDLDKMEGVYFKRVLLIEKREFKKWMERQRTM